MAKPRNETTLLERSDRDATTSIADAAYDAAISGEGWADLLDDLRRSLGAEAIALIEYDPLALAGLIHQSIGLKPGFARAYENGQAAQDLWMRRLDFSSDASVIKRGDELVPERLLFASNFRRDWLAPQDLCHSMLAVQMRRERRHIVIAAFRNEAHGRFEDQVTRIFAHEAAHLSRALKIHHILNRTATEREAALAALDQVPIGVIIVDDLGMVLDSNHVANEILASNDGLTVGRQGLKGHTPEETAALRELIDLATRRSGQVDLAATDTLSFERPSGGSKLAVTVTRLPLTNRFLGTHRRAAAIYVTDPDKRFDLDTGKLRQLYKLTPAEARLAARLAQGLRLEDAATDLGVSLNTVRTHLKRIFSKTETDRQAELVRLILSGPARILMNRRD